MLTIIEPRKYFRKKIAATATYLDIWLQIYLEDRISHNLYMASLAPGAYANQPKFSAFRSGHALGFKAHERFTKDDWIERQRLVAQLVELVWSPERLHAYAT